MTLLILYIVVMSLLLVAGLVYLVRVARADVRRTDRVNNTLNNLEVRR